MQAITTCKILPPKLPSPTNPPPPKTTQPLVPPPRAISITAPIPNNHPPAVPLSPVKDDTVDDSVAAFWDYQFLFVSQRSETSDPVPLRAVSGAVPPDFPSGTYYLTGPGLFTDDHGSTVHPLDGHGYLRAFTVDGESGRIEFRARYVKTEAQEEEHDEVSGAWRFTHRGPFSVLKGGKKIGNTKVMKNVANTSVLRWGGKLLCLWEGGDPYEIESESLDTVGKLEMVNGGDARRRGADPSGGRNLLLDVAASFLKPVLHGVYKMPAKRMLSHYKVDPKRERLLTISCNAEDMLLPRSNFTFCEFDSKFNLVEKQEFNIPDHLMIHDWAFTDSHYILFGNRIKLDALGSLGAVCGVSPMISALSVNPSKANSPIYLLPRDPHVAPTERDWRVPIEVPSQLWLLHCGNAFEAKLDDGTMEINLQASACSYDWFNFKKLFGYNWQSGRLDPSTMNAMPRGEIESLPHLIQISMKLKADGECEKCNIEPLNPSWTNSSDFPVINPNFSGYQNNIIYGATASGSREALPHFPFDSVVKLNKSDNSVKTWYAGQRRFIGEPIFVPKGTTADEDDGYILVVEYAVSIQRCYLVILDPKKIGEDDGAFVGRFEVPKNLNFPLGFHGFWASDN